MTIQTLGTNATNSLTAFQWNSVAASQAGVRAINVLIRDDQNARHPLAQTNGSGGFVKEGLLTVPNRGVLQLFPGDVVGVDATSGQVILMSAIGLNSWTFVGSTLGTNTPTSLDVALRWRSIAVSTADVALVNSVIYDDQNPRFPFAQDSGTGGFVKEGLLYVPNRGTLQLFPGDIVAVDSSAGMPILLTAYGLSAGPWTLT